MPKLTQKSQVNIRDYLLIIFLRKKFFLLPFMIVFFTASLGSFFLPKYYRASVLIKVEEKKPINPLAIDERLYKAQIETTLMERMKTLTEEILSYDKLYTLIKDADLFESNESEAVAFESLMKDLRKRIRVRMVSPDIFTVYYEDKGPLKAERVLNRLMDIFIEENKEKKKKEANVGVSYALSQAEIYKRKLDEAEKKLQEFREEHAMELPGSDTDINVQMLINFQIQLSSAVMDINSLKEKINKISRQLSGEEPVIISEDMLDLNPIVTQLNSELQELQLTLDEFLMKDPESEKIYELEKTIEDKRQRLQRETKKNVNAETITNDPLFYQRLRQRLNNAQANMDDLKDRERELQAQIKIYEDRMKSLPEQESEYSRLSRDVEVNDQIYKMLNLKAEESRLTAEELEERGINYEIFGEEGAKASLKPAKPQKLLMSLVALLLGFISGIGCVFIAEFADSSFKNTEDAISFLNLPCLGSVSKIMTEEELLKRKRSKKNFTVLFIILILALIITALASIYIEEKKSLAIIAQQEEIEE